MPRRASNRDLPVHQTREKDITGLGEFLAISLEFCTLSEHLFNGLIEEVAQTVRRTDQLAAVGKITI